MNFQPIARWRKFAPVVFFAVSLLCCGNNSEDGLLNGKTDIELKTAYGVPLHDRTLPIKDMTFTEMHVELELILNREKDKNILIRELMFRVGDYYLVAWLVEKNNVWEAFHCVRFHKNTEF